MNIIAIILARGGSKSIPKKNIINFCGEPLICWTIKQAKNSKFISDVWVSSDNDEILEISEKSGSKIIKRPKNLSNDSSSSTSALIHAVNKIEKIVKKIDLIIVLQATSPVREIKDIDSAIGIFKEKKYDSLFTSTKFEGRFIWKQNKMKKLTSINYDFKKRKRRQEIEEQFLENGSFYIFKPIILKKYSNFLGGKIGTFTMDMWKSFEIDEYSELEICELFMKKYILKK